jgi:hypothetical protein
MPSLEHLFIACIGIRIGQRQTLPQGGPKKHTLSKRLNTCCIWAADARMPKRSMHKVNKART